jgi:hypothetical protein
VKVELKFEGVHRKLDSIPKNDGLGLFLATEAMRGMSPYVPMRDGFLDASAVATPFEVSYTTPYAGIVYYGDGLKFSHERHALATSHWADAYSAAHIGELAQAATAYLKR